MSEVGAEIKEKGNFAEIIESILEESRSKADQIIKEAKEKAEEMIRQAEKTAKRIKDQKKREMERALRDELAKRRSAVEIRFKREILTTQRHYLDLLFEKVRQKLALIAENKISEWNYEEILKNYAREAAENLGTKKIYIWGREKDIPLLRKIAEELSDEMAVKFEVDDARRATIIGGLIARDEKDTRRFYNTFEGRLADYRERNEPRLIDMLFGGDNR